MNCSNQAKVADKMSFDWSQWEPNTLKWEEDFFSHNFPDLQNSSSNQSNPNRLPDLVFSDGFPDAPFGCDTNLNSTPSHPTSDDAPYSAAKGNSATGSAEGQIRMLKQFMQHLEQQFAQFQEKNKQLFSERLESLENE